MLTIDVHFRLSGIENDTLDTRQIDAVLTSTQRLCLEQTQGNIIT